MRTLVKASSPSSLEAKQATKSLGFKIKLATYDGSSNWKDYKARFETCATQNNWSNEDKCLHLAVVLRGQAQGVSGNVSDKSHNFEQLIKALEERFAQHNPRNFIWFNQGKEDRMPQKHFLNLAKI